MADRPEVIQRQPENRNLFTAFSALPPVDSTLRAPDQQMAQARAQTVPAGRQPARPASFEVRVSHPINITFLTTALPERDRHLSQPMTA